LQFLPYISNVASILTSLIAVAAAFRVLYFHYVRRKKLEGYLANIARTAYDKDVRSRSILHLSSALGMSEDDILRASFDSKRILRELAANERTGRAEAILLKYRSA
jgi:hypothetical protein